MRDLVGNAGVDRPMAVTRHGVALHCQRVGNTKDFLEHYKIWRIILPPVVVNKGRLEGDPRVRSGTTSSRCTE